MPKPSWVSLPIALPGLMSVSPQIRDATMPNTRLAATARQPSGTGMSNSARRGAAGGERADERAPLAGERDQRVRDQQRCAEPDPEIVPGTAELASRGHD